MIIIFLGKPKLHSLLGKGKHLIAWGNPKLAPLREDISSSGKHQCSILALLRENAQKRCVFGTDI
jgi:hypothetical protein